MILLGLLLSFSFVSCSGDDDNNNFSGSDLTEIVVGGSWRVTLYQEDAVNHTHHFSGYSFTFNSDGSLIASNESISQAGTWTTGNDDSTNKLWINFPSAPEDDPFEEISEDWQIVTKTSSKIELRHVSGGDGSIDLLTFEKN